ncbi:MAG: insulinase family protein [Candidatus Cloacimonetes bacterium]|nr:insulinase family protein [Candidatus Cloacimonadota bacterium]
MKKRYFLLAVMFIFFGLQAAEELYEKLPNGMEVVVKKNDNNTSVGFFCFVKTGSMNEGRYLGAGISHYLEHVVSSGSTSKRSETEYMQLGKEIGAIVNAYTTNILTAYFIIVDKENRDQGLEILSEQMQFCVFDSMEVAREKEVILKEIVMRSTSVDDKIRQRYSELVYPASNKRYPVIGYTDLFRTITRDQLEDYYQRRYAPNNMVFVVVGDLDPAEMMDQVKDTFKDFKRKQIVPEYLPEQLVRPGNLEFFEEFEIQQPQVYLSTILPAADLQDSWKINTVLDLLFGKRKSPIRYKLVEELQLVNYIYAYANSMFPPEGEIEIFFEAKDPLKVKEIVDIIDQEILSYSKLGFKQKDLDELINRYEASNLLSTPGVSSECNRIGWSMITYGVTDQDDIYLDQLKRMSIADCTEMLEKYLIPKNRAVFYALPKGSLELMEKEEATSITKTEPQKYQLSDDLILIHKQNTEKPLVKGSLFLPVSSAHETPDNAGSVAFMLQMMFKGSNKYDPLDLTEWKEDHAVTFNVSHDDDGVFIDFKCLKNDFPELIRIMTDAFRNPSFPASELNLAREQKTASYKRSMSDAYSHHREFANQILFPGTKEGLSNEAYLDIILKLSQHDLKDLHADFFKADLVTFSLFGDLTREEAESWSREIKKQIPVRKSDSDYPMITVPEIDSTFTQEYEFEQVNIDLFYPAPTLEDDDFMVMYLIRTFLSGARGRIHMATRGTNDLAYFAFPDYSYSKNSGIFRLSSQTSIDKRDELVQVLLNEIERLRTELVTPEELEESIAEYQKILNSYLNDNSLPHFMAYYESIGLGYDFIKRFHDEFQSITPEDIQRVANTYFAKSAIIVSIPNPDVELMVE